MPTLDELRATHSEPTPEPIAVETPRDLETPLPTTIRLGAAICFHPGCVISASDGEKHHVSADDLGRLYGLTPEQTKEARVRSKRGEWPTPECDIDERVCLFPKADGDYKLPQEVVDRIKPITGKIKVEVDGVDVTDTFASVGGAAAVKEGVDKAKARVKVVADKIRTGAVVLNGRSSYRPTAAESAAVDAALARGTTAGQMKELENSLKAMGQAIGIGAAQAADAMASAFRAIEAEADLSGKIFDAAVSVGLVEPKPTLWTRIKRRLLSWSIR